MTIASGQFVRLAKNDGSIDYGVSELQHANKCLESKQRIRISYEDSIYRGNYRTSQGILLLRKHNLGSTNFDFYRQISEKFQFFQAILQKNIEFSRQISENFDFFRQLKH